MTTATQNSTSSTQNANTTIRSGTDKRPPNGTRRGLGIEINEAGARKHPRASRT